MENGITMDNLSSNDFNPLKAQHSSTLPRSTLPPIGPSSQYQKAKPSPWKPGTPALATNLRMEHPGKTCWEMERKVPLKRWRDHLGNGVCLKYFTH